MLEKKIKNLQIELNRIILNAENKVDVIKKKPQEHQVESKE